MEFKIINQPAVFMNRDALAVSGYLDLNYHYLLDHHLWLRIACQGKMVHAHETVGSREIPRCGQECCRCRQLWRRSLPDGRLDEEHPVHLTRSREESGTGS